MIFHCPTPTAAIDSPPPPAPWTRTGLRSSCLVTTIVAVIVIVVVDIDLDSIRIRNRCHRARRLNRLISILRARASRDKADGGPGLPLQRGHGIGALGVGGSSSIIIIYLHSVGAVIGIGLAGLCPGDRLGGDVVDVGTREREKGG